MDAWHTWIGPGWRFGKGGGGAWTKGPKPASACGLGAVVTQQCATSARQRVQDAKDRKSIRLALFDH
jgi:hypothetical protein